MRKPNEDSHLRRLHVFRFCRLAKAMTGSDEPVDVAEIIVGVEKGFLAKHVEVERNRCLNAADVKFRESAIGSGDRLLPVPAFDNKLCDH